MVKSILYTGNLNRRYGIEKLLSVFNGWTDKGYQLWMRGDGEMKEFILNMEKEGKRVKYYPAMAKSELNELLKKADVLVNPVSSDQEFTRFFFPSKTMEYLASGTPVVMYHLACMPREYDNHIIYVEGERVADLQDAILKGCNIVEEDRIMRAEAARSFILNEKSAKIQIRRVLDFINENILNHKVE